MSDECHKGFPGELRLKVSDDFKRVFNRRCSVADDVLIVYGCDNGLPHSRIGLSVSRKVGGAVQRNRWKRLIREAYRTNRHQIPEGVDLVVIPRRGKEATAEGVADSLTSLAARVSRKLQRSAK